MTTHKREIWPFRRSPDAFEDTAMRTDASADFDPAESVFIIHEDEADVPETLEVEIRFDLDDAEIEEAAGLPSSKIDIAVVLEQKSVRVSRVLDRWALEDVPRHWESSFRPADVTTRNTIRTVAILNSQRDRSSSNAATREGSLLAERTFVIRRPISESLFPVKNTSFKERDLDQQALWYVEYHSPEEAHQLRPSDVFSVHLNSDLEALNHLWLKSTPRRGSIPRVMANMVRKMVVAGIIGDVSVALLGRFYRMREDDPDLSPEEESTVEMILNFLETKVGKPVDDILYMASENEGDLRAAIQHAVDCGKAFGLEPLHRIRDVE